jgi:hypothetical protein
MKKILLLFLLLAHAVACTTGDSFENVDDPSSNQDNTTPAPTVPTDPGDTGDGELIPNSQAVNFENAVTITFSTSGVSINNPFEGNGVNIETNGGHVTLTSTVGDKELTYVLSGITDNGSVKIYGSYKFGLALNGTGITNPNGAAINIQCKKKISVTIVGQTNNRLIDGKDYNYINGEDMKGTFFSEGQLNFYGDGLLEVRGKNKHGICTDDYFRQYAGHIHIKEAASDGIHANDEVSLEGGALTVRSAGDGVESEKSTVSVAGGVVNIVTTGEKGHGLKSAKETTISSNPVINITTYGNVSKCISSNAALDISGGSLTLSAAGDALYNAADAEISSSAGIKCDGDMTIAAGNIYILSTGKGGKGISVDGSLTINGGVTEVTTTGGQFKYGKNDTAAKAIKSDGNLTVNDGVVKLKTYGVEAEGLESKDTLTIRNGMIEIEAYDDAINASSHIQIDGGTIYCYSTVNDGIDSNGTMSITGGLIVSLGASSPEEGFDCDNNTFKITGGTLVGTGGATSKPTASVTTKCTVECNVNYASLYHIEAADGTEIMTFKMPRTYNGSVCMLFGGGEMTRGTSYTLYSGGSVSGGVNFHGLYSDATYTKGSAVGTFTGSAYATVGTASGSPGPGGQPGTPGVPPGGRP